MYDIVLGIKMKILFHYLKGQAFKNLKHYFKLFVSTFPVAYLSYIYQKMDNNRNVQQLMDNNQNGN